MSEFDDFDDRDLGAALRHLAGPIPDADSAFAPFQRRVRVVRRQRIATWTVAGAAVLTLTAVVGTLAGRATRQPAITPADQDVRLPGVTDSVADSTVAPTVPTPGTEPRPDDRGTGASGRPGGTSGRGGGVTAGGGSGEDGGLDGQTGGDSGSGSSTSTSTTSTSTTTTSLPPTSTTARTRIVCTSGAGSIEVTFDGRMQLVATRPASGYQVKETETERAKVKVVFVSGESESSVSARWSKGRLTCGGANRPDGSGVSGPDRLDG